MQLLLTLPGQNSKEMLLRMLQHFVVAYVLSTPTFYRRLKMIVFVNIMIIINLSKPFRFQPLDTC